MMRRYVSRVPFSLHPYVCVCLWRWYNNLVTARTNGIVTTRWHRQTNSATLVIDRINWHSRLDQNLCNSSTKCRRVLQSTALSKYSWFRCSLHVLCMHEISMSIKYHQQSCTQTAESANRFQWIWMEWKAQVKQIKTSDRSERIRQFYPSPQMSLFAHC